METVRRAQAGFTQIFSKLSRQHKQFLSTLSGLLLLMLVFTVLSPFFFSLNNFLTVATQTAVIAITFEAGGTVRVSGTLKSV